jgi:hypothetical protein
MLTKELKATTLLKSAFTVKVTHEMKISEEGAPHVTELPHLSKAITSFNFYQSGESPVDVADEEADISALEFGADQDEDDGDGYDDAEYDMVPDFALALTHEVTYDVLAELQNAMPIPDDSEIVVRIQYHTSSHEGSALRTPVFYHEFRGVLALSTNVAASVNDTGRLETEVVLDCWEFKQFCLIP